MSSSSANPVVYNAEGATSVSRDSSRPNVYRRPVDSAWGNEFGGLFGGYTTAVALRALQRHFTRNPDPLTLSLTYIAAPTSPGGDLEIEIEENKTGRTFAFAGVKVFWLPPEKSGKTRVILLAGVATMGNLGAARNSPSFRERRPLLGSGYKAEADYPPPEECLDRIGADAPRPFMRHFKFRESPAGVERTKRESSRIDKERLDENVVEHAAWYAARDDQPADYTIAVLCADIPLPIEHPEERLIDPTDRSRMAYSTITQTLEFHDRIPEDNGPWLLLQHTYVHKLSEMIFEEFKVWTRSGKLVLTARQQGWRRVQAQVAKANL